MTGRARRLRAANGRLFREFHELQRQERELELQYVELEEELIKLQAEAMKTEHRARMWEHHIQVWERQLKFIIDSTKTRKLNARTRDMEALMAMVTNLKMFLYGRDGDMQGVLGDQINTAQTIAHFCGLVRSVKCKLRKNRGMVRRQEDGQGNCPVGAGNHSNKMEVREYGQVPEQAEMKSNGEVKKRFVASDNGNDN